MTKAERRMVLMLAILSGLSICPVRLSQADETKPQPKKVYQVADLVIPIQKTHVGILGGGDGKPLANSQRHADIAVRMPTNEALTYPSGEEFEILTKRGKEYRRFSIAHTLRDDERLMRVEKRLKDIESKLDLLLKKER